jgi:predicted RND superfamily exporter protein
LVNRLVSADGSVIGVNVTLQFPEKELDETSRAAAFARELAAEIEERYPHVETHLTGMAMLNNAFQEAAIRDMQILVPIMYLGVMVVMFIALRSVSGTFATVVIIGSSVATAMGIAGWLGIKLTAPSSTAPTMIMTLAVATFSSRWSAQCVAAWRSSRRWWRVCGSTSSRCSSRA